MLPDLRTKRFGSWFGNLPFNVENMFNATVPTNNGSIPNNIGTDNWPNNLRAEKSFYANEDLVGVVEGCKGQCELTLRTLALFPTSCTTHKQPVDYKTTYDYKAVLNGEHAPPFESLGIFVSITMDVSGKYFDQWHISAFEAMAKLTCAFADSMQANARRLTW